MADHVNYHVLKRLLLRCISVDGRKMQLLSWPGLSGKNENWGVYYLLDDCRVAIINELTILLQGA